MAAKRFSKRVLHPKHFFLTYWHVTSSPSGLLRWTAGIPAAHMDEQSSWRNSLGDSAPRPLDLQQDVKQALTRSHVLFFYVLFM